MHIYMYVNIYISNIMRSASYASSFCFFLFSFYAIFMLTSAKHLPLALLVFLLLLWLLYLCLYLYLCTLTLLPL